MIKKETRVEKAQKPRIIVIDDNPNIHNDYREILLMASEAHSSTKSPSDEEDPFAPIESVPSVDDRKELSLYRLDSAYQGQEGIDMIQKAVDEGDPYMMAFIDMKMPPGIDGMVTTKKVFEISGFIQVVICTAHSDYEWFDFVDDIVHSDRLLLLKKPFEPIEILQVTANLIKKAEIVRERSATMELLKDRNMKLKESNAVREEFLANVSHELRTPMHGILCFAQLGLEEIVTEEEIDRESMKDHFKKILDSGGRLLKLVNDLLDTSKLENSKMSYHPHQSNIKEAIEVVLNEVGGLLTEKDLKVELEGFDGENLAFFDRERVIQVLSNLISNAIKFSHPKETIFIRLEKVCENGGKYLKIGIEDRGKEVPADELESIFDKFVQSSKTKSKSGGTGLGLSICKRIIEDHQGRIWAESDREGLTCFSFTLPEQEMTRKILVIDDDPIFVRVLSSHLKKLGFETFQAKSAEEGLTIARENFIYAAFTDFMMGGEDGLDFAMKVRDIYHDLPIILVSGTDISEFKLEQEKFEYLEKVEFFRKPVSQAKVAELLSKLIA